MKKVYSVTSRPQQNETRSIFKKDNCRRYRAVGSLNTNNNGFQSSNVLLLLLCFIDFGQW